MSVGSVCGTDTSPTTPQHASYAVVNERSLETGRKGMKPSLSAMVLNAIYKYVFDATSEQTSTTPGSDDTTSVLITGYSEGIVHRQQVGEPVVARHLTQCQHPATICFRVRCHPSYRSQRAWHDWVNILPPQGNDHNNTLTPCKLMALFSWRYLGQRTVQSERYMAVVWSVSAVSLPGEVLAERRVRMFASVEEDIGSSVPVLSVVDVNATAVGRVLVMEDQPQLQDIYHSPLHDRRTPHLCSVISDMRQSWAAEFTGAVSEGNNYEAVIQKRLQHRHQREQQRLAEVADVASTNSLERAATIDQTINEPLLGRKRHRDNCRADTIFRHAKQTEVNLEMRLCTWSFYSISFRFFLCRLNFWSLVDLSV